MSKEWAGKGEGIGSDERGERAEQGKRAKEGKRAGSVPRRSVYQGRAIEILSSALEGGAPW